MDEASTRFKSTEADCRQEFYERVVKDTTMESGSVFFERKGSSTEMGLRLNPPNARFIEYRNGTARIFDPGTDHLTELHASQYESFLTLGFGGKGSDLARAWNVTDKGAEKIDGVDVEHLDLVAKDPAARNNFTHVEIWVDPTRAISLKQQLFTPSGDYRTSTYTNIRYNKSVNQSPYAIKTDKKTTIDRR